MLSEIFSAYCEAQLKILQQRESDRPLPAIQGDFVMRDDQQGLSNNDNLPVAIDVDFEGDNNVSDRLIQGSLLRCVDGHWTNRDGMVFGDDARFLVLGTTTALQRWQNNLPADVIMKKAGEPLPPADDLNATIPENTWERDLNGEPRPPWAKTYVVYLVDVNDASIYTYANGTVGARVAVERLRDRVTWMRRLRGEKVVPVVKLANRLVSKRFGKLGPEFTILEWRDLSADLPAPTVPRQIEQKAQDPVKRVGQPVSEPPWSEILDDDLPNDLK
jgi:hypothetical protein